MAAQQSPCHEAAPRNTKIVGSPPLRRSSRIISAAATATALVTSTLPRAASSFLTNPQASLHGTQGSLVGDRAALQASKNSTPAKRKAPSTVGRTESFSAVWHGSLAPKEFRDGGAPVKPHTLILGTHPSIASLDYQQYFGHDMNAFWWIAGDCLGFRRRPALSASSNKPYSFAAHLRFDNILSYAEQLELFTSRGFCLWDVVQSCQRPGSLDQDIRHEVPNNIRAFVREHPTIRRIVFANGSSGCKFFIRHFKDWLQSGELFPVDHEASVKVFGKHCTGAGTGRIELISALAVSPAAARWTYQEKRDFWERYVYLPGLKDHEKMIGSVKD